jgi:ABC-2 type transport system permease protein
MKAFARQLCFELLKLFARRRTYLGFAAFLVIELVILMMLQTPFARRRFTHAMTMQGLDFSHFFSGLTVAYVMMSNTVFVLGSLYLALVCGDIVSKEVEDGTMRMVLSRPVSRLRVLGLKYGACVFYTALLGLFVVLSSLATGILIHGFGNLTVMAPMEDVFAFFAPAAGMQRFALAGIALIFCLVTLSTLAFMFSCFNLKPATATILTLSVFIIDDILRHIPFLSDMKKDFLGYHMTVWTHLFERVIPWQRIFESFGYLLVVDVLALTVAGAYFLRRDFKS